MVAEQGGSYDEEKLLHQCHDRSLELAYKHKCKSVAFSLMATGTYAFPKELELQIAVDSFKDFLEDHEMEITLVVFTEYAYKISGNIFDTVESFVDSHYVGGALDAEYKPESIPEDGAPLFDEEFEEEDNGGDFKEVRLNRPVPPMSTLPSFIGSAGAFKASETAPAKLKKKSLDNVLKGIYTVI